MEDEGAVYIETVDKIGVPTPVLDTETDQQLMMDYITEKDVEKYFVQPKEQENKDETETISSKSMTDYDRDEVEASLTTIADAFHKIGNEYEHLCSIIPHMSKTQAANVISRLPMIPFMGKNMPVKTEPKMEPERSEPVATMTTTVTTPDQMSTTEVMITSGQKKTAIAQTTTRTPLVVGLDTAPEAEIDIEKDAEASKRSREVEVNMERSGI